MSSSDLLANVWEDREAGPSSRGRALPVNLLPDVRRSEQVEACLQRLLEGGVVALCAAPGMGKTALARQIAAEFEHEGHKVLSVCAEGMTAKRLISSLRRMTRSRKVRAGATPLVIIDDIPSFDDYDIGLLLRLIQGLRDRGHRIVLSLRPEASQLVEQLDDALVLESGALLVGRDELARWGGHLGRDEEESLLSFTGGIPALLNEVRHAGCSPEEMGDMALPGLPGLVWTCLRKSLMHEERAIRLAMLLLGRGSIGELGSCVSRLDHEELRSLLVDEPLLGVRRSLRSFECIGAISKGDLANCEEALRAASQDLQDVVRAAARCLLARGEARRASVALRCCIDRSKRDEIVLSWPGELLNCGELGLVRDAVGQRGAAGDADPGKLAVARSMVLSVDGKADKAARQLGLADGVASLSRQAGQARALLDSCRARKGTFPPATASANDGSPLPADGPTASPDALTRSLGLHVLVRSLLARGKAEEAYRHLLVGPERLDEPLLSSALLGGDVAIVGALMGDEPARRDSTADGSSLGFLMAGGFADQLAYQLAERGCLASLAGEGQADDQIDQALRIATRRGDALEQANAMVYKALGDVARGSHARAVVLLEQATRVARELGMPYVLDLAIASRMLVGLCAGEDVGPWVREAAGRGDDASPELGAMVATARAMGGGRPSRMAGTGRCPASSLPFLLVASRLCGEVSDVVRQVLPVGWDGEVEGFAQRWGVVVGDHARVAPDAPGQEGGGDLLEVRLLGGFGVRCRGREVPDDSWRRRAARTLLELLMIVPQHEVTRELACEALWPQSDLYTARNNIYAVMTALRRAIGQLRGGPQYVLVDGGVIRADRSLVRCDVDDFRRTARAVLADGGDDVRCVSECCELEGRYPGNIVIPPSDPTGIFTKHHQEISTLYADAMLSGSDAALRLGKATVAVRLARNASSIDPLREDVEENVVRALIAAGRTHEARLHYESYARRVISAMGVPPTSRLRRMVREMCGQVREARTGRLEDGIFEGA